MAIAELENKEKEAKTLKQAIKELDVELNSEMDAKKRKASLARYVKMLPEGYLRRSVRPAGDRPEAHQPPAVHQRPEPGRHGPSHPAHGVRQLRQGLARTASSIPATSSPGTRRSRASSSRTSSTPSATSGSDIANIAKNYHAELEKIARTVEDHFKEIRSIRFTVENKRLWLIDQRSVMTKSTQADIRLLLDLHARKIVDDAYVVKQIKPGQLNEILHPIIDFTLGEGAEDPHGRHHRRPGRRHRPDLLLHRRPPGGVQARAAEGPGHQAHPLPGLAPSRRTSRPSRWPRACSPPKAATRRTPRSSPASTARSPS